VRRHETPTPRTNPSGKTVWVARWTDRAGKIHIGWRERGVRGTYARKGACRAPADDASCCAQHAIDRCYEMDAAAPASAARRGMTVTEYGEQRWLQRHPRSRRTDLGYIGKLRAVTNVEIEGVPFGQWPMADVRRPHVTDLIDHMLRKQGRAANGAKAVVRVLSTMWADAIDDEVVTDTNPFLGITVRASDPRIVKAPRKARVWSWQQMHQFAAAAALPVDDHDDVPEMLRPHFADGWAQMNAWRRAHAEPMLRLVSDCGLRLGELLPLERGDVFAGACGDLRCKITSPHLHVRQTAWRGTVDDGAKQDRLRAARGAAPLIELGRPIPIPPDLWAMLEARPVPMVRGAARLQKLLFPGVGGKLWSESWWYTQLWTPARTSTGMTAAVPHDFRHSWVSHLRAAGVDPADLALMAGHTVLTATAVYTHSTGRSFDAAAAAVGA